MDKEHLITLAEAARRFTERNRLDENLLAFTEFETELVRAEDYLNDEAGRGIIVGPI